MLNGSSYWTTSRIKVPEGIDTLLNWESGPDWATFQVLPPSEDTCQLWMSASGPLTSGSAIVLLALITVA